MDSPVLCERQDLSSTESVEDPMPVPSRCELLIQAPPAIQGFKETLEMAKPDPALRTDTTKPRREAATALLLGMLIPANVIDKTETVGMGG